MKTCLLLLHKILQSRHLMFSKLRISCIGTSNILRNYVRFKNRVPENTKSVITISNLIEFVIIFRNFRIKVA